MRRPGGLPGTRRIAPNRGFHPPSRRRLPPVRDLQYVAGSTRAALARGARTSTAVRYPPDGVGVSVLRVDSRARARRARVVRAGSRGQPPGASQRTPIKQLLAAAGYGTGGRYRVNPAMRASPPQPHSRDSRPALQPALAFVEQADEQHDSGAQLLRHEVGIRHRSDQPRSGQQGAPCAQLLRLAGTVDGTIQEPAGKFLAGQLAFLDELAEDILGADVKQVVQLLAEMSGWAAVNGNGTLGLVVNRWTAPSAHYSGAY